MLLHVVVLPLIGSCVHAFDVQDSLQVSHRGGWGGARYVAFMSLCFRSNALVFTRLMFRIHFRCLTQKVLGGGKICCFHVSADARDAVEHRNLLAVHRLNKKPGLESVRAASLQAQSFARAYKSSHLLPEAALALCRKTYEKIED